MSHPARTMVGSVAGITAVVYLVLVCLAAGCLFMHAGSPGGHDHHAQDSGHSALCAWACQASSESGLVASGPAEISGLVAIASLVPLVEPLSTSPSSSTHSRAPPVSTLG